MSALPPPPAPEEITLTWILANKATLAAYMQAIYRQDTLQVVVISNGVRSAPVSVKVAGLTAILEITV